MHTEHELLTTAEVAELTRTPSAPSATGASATAVPNPSDSAAASSTAPATYTPGSVPRKPQSWT
jgi:hypothetical protein